MNNYLVNITFNGTDFAGTQIQPGYPTIQGLFMQIISNYLNEEVKITCCSRLDKGVHAENFYFNFKTEKELDFYRFQYYLNNFTPQSVRINNLQKVKEDFSSRYHAKKKVYCYSIHFGEKLPFNYQTVYLSPYPQKRDVKDIDLSIFLGEHDFRNFSSDDDAESFVSELESVEIKHLEKDNIYQIYVTGKSFFRYQVRYIAGAIYEMMIGKKREDEIEEMLEATLYTKHKLKLPGQGLILKEVIYDKEDLDV